MDSLLDVCTRWRILWQTYTSEAKLQNQKFQLLICCKVMYLFLRFHKQHIHIYMSSESSCILMAGEVLTVLFSMLNMFLPKVSFVLHVFTVCKCKCIIRKTWDTNKKKKVHFLSHIHKKICISIYFYLPEAVKYFPLTKETYSFCCRALFLIACTMGRITNTTSV